MTMRPPPIPPRTRSEVWPIMDTIPHINLPIDPSTGQSRTCACRTYKATAYGERETQLKLVRNPNYFIDKANMIFGQPIQQNSQQDGEQMFTVKLQTKDAPQCYNGPSFLLHRKYIEGAIHRESRSTDAREVITGEWSASLMYATMSLDKVTTTIDPDRARDQGRLPIQAQDLTEFVSTCSMCHNPRQ